MKTTILKEHINLRGDKKHDTRVFHQEEYIQVYLIISMNILTRYEMIIYVTIHAPT